MNETNNKLSDKIDVLHQKKSDTWVSDLKIITSINVIIPLKLLLVCNHITSIINDDEFSIVTNIKEKTLDKIVLDEEFYIPKQIVTSGFIDYLQDEYSHNVVIHRHPDGLNTFTSTDQSFINENFEVSLLYTKKDSFVNGIYNLKIEDTIFRMPVKITIDYGSKDLDLSNIERKRNYPEICERTIEKTSLQKDTMLYPEEMLEDLHYRVQTLEGYFYR